MAEEQLVTFRLGTEEFGIDIMMVQEIIRIPPITRVPQAPYYVEGVINLRGNVISVVNLRARFGLPNGHFGAEEESQNRIIVVKGKEREFGIRVDSVSEVLQLPDTAIEPPPSVAVGIDASFIRGLGKAGDRLIVLLNLGNVLRAVKEGEASA